MNDSNSAGLGDREVSLRKQHQLLEEKIDALNAQEFMTPREQTERKRMQKLKLAIRDELVDLRHHSERERS